MSSLLHRVGAASQAQCGCRYIAPSNVGCWLIFAAGTHCSAIRLLSNSMNAPCGSCGSTCMSVRHLRCCTLPTQLQQPGCLYMNICTLLSAHCLRLRRLLNSSMQTPAAAAYAAGYPDIAAAAAGIRCCIPTLLWVAQDLVGHGKAAACCSLSASVAIAQQPMCILSSSVRLPLAVCMLRLVADSRCRIPEPQRLLLESFFCHGTLLPAAHFLRL